MELKNRVQLFLEETGLPLSRFGKNVNLTADSLRKWMKGELNLKQSNLIKIDNWLKSFNR